MDAATCCCSELDDLAVVGMGDTEGLDERLFDTLDSVKDHGGGQWWLHASICRICGQNWMIAQDERIHDNFCLKRIDPGTMQMIIRDSLWPDDFIRFEDVLRVERQSGRIAVFLNSHSWLLEITAHELRAERPDISSEEVAYLLAISVEGAQRLLAKA